MIRTFDFLGSSMLANCSYDDETEELSVTFANGRTYVYEGVDKAIYDSLIDAKSAGKYFNSIKSGLKQKT